jgi:hypothetical protein
MSGVPPSDLRPAASAAVGAMLTANAVKPVRHSQLAEGSFPG